MRFDTGIHPRQWHRGAWLLAFLLAALVLLLTHTPTGGRAFAQTVPAPPPPTEATTPFPIEGVPAPDDAVKAPPAEGEAPAAPSAEPADASKDGYVAEIVDSSYTVGPAEFFALDLPMKKAGARAVHLFGTVSTKGNKDIVVRLFRSSDYDLWLKKKAGTKPQALWTSKRSANLTLDQDLPAGVPVVLLLDNGYSIRTVKKVSCQLQLRYERNPTETFDTEGVGSMAGGTKVVVPEDNLPTPRSNSEQEMPPPPPPPPSGY